MEKLMTNHKILYCSLKYDYAEKDRGYSYEYYNIEHGMKECAANGMFDLEVFHIDDERINIGHEAADLKFESVIDEYKPTIIFHTSFDDNWDVDHKTLLLCQAKGIKTIEFCPDASWRFQEFLFPRRDRYTHFITTHNVTIPWFEQYNMRVIKSQWGGSSLYTKQQKEYKYDVSFVGQKHGLRTQLVNALNTAGIKVHLFGNYWDGHPDNNGFISFEKMIDVFNTSKINLNFSNPFHTGTMPQIKGRHFEIPQCGGFQLATPADDIESYFMPDKEIVLAENVMDIIHKIKHYLSNDEAREQIAEAGLRRMMDEHQWKHRFEHILKEIDNGSA